MRARCLEVLVIGVGLTVAAHAAAQEEASEAAAAPPLPEAGEVAHAGEPAPLAAQPVTAAADARPHEPTHAARADDAGEPASEPEAPPAESGLPEWLRGLSVSAFADAYAQGVWTVAHPFSGDHSDVLAHRAFTTEAGLTLSFLGVDIAYRFESVGARLDIRLGTSVPRLLGPTSGLPDGMQFLKQAFVFWRPVEQLQIDFGQFDTIYGAEVADSWRNHTYSRGSLYNLVQPFYHTGLRVAWEPVESVTLTGIAVNGWNNVLDGNDGKTFGLQASWSSGGVGVAAGYLGGPEGTRDDLWRHFADLVVTLRVDQLELALNGDYVAEQVEDGSFDQLWGVMLSGRLRVPPLFAVALRGEVIGDPEAGAQLYTGTLTLELTPVEHLVIRLDNRVDAASDPRFQDNNGLPAHTVMSTILGVVVHSD